MKISVITVCYNSEKTIETTIKSVVEQTYENIEYIIIDGKSSDNTLNIIEQYKDKISKIVSEKDNGIYDAMNKGIAESSGEYLFFLNADDSFYDKLVIEKIVKQLSIKETDFIYGNLNTVNIAKRTSFIKKQNKLNKIYLLKNTPCQPTLFASRAVFKKCGGFSTKHKIVSDYEWILKAILEYKVSCQYVDITISNFNIGGISTNPEQNKLHDAERDEVINKYFTPFERKSYELISKYLRSLTTVPIISDLLNILFKYRISQ